jgi:hypothetical protein
MRMVAIIVGGGLALGAGWAIARVVIAGENGNPSPPQVALHPFGAIPKPRVDRDHDGLDDQFEQRIAAQYAPVLFFEAQERTYPASVTWLLGRMELQHREDGCSPDHTSSLQSESGPMLDHLLGPGPHHHWTFPDDFSDVGPRLNCQDSNRTSLSTVEGLPDGPDGSGIGDEQNLQLAYTNGGPDDATKAGELAPSQWATYVHIYPSRDHGVIVQYWHAFPYNPVPLDTHEGDWDASLQVKLDAQLSPVGAWFSRHSNDAPGHWIPISRLSTYQANGGTHIEEAIDSGGHGAYASPQDWCSHPDTVHAGVEPHLSIVWPEGTANPNAATLHHQNCSLVGLPGHLNAADSATGGTIWQTWDGGTVTQRGDNLAQKLNSKDSPGGRLINVGECNPGHQAAKLDEGRCYPLNRQSFIEYSGQWGTTRGGDLGIGPTSPRGPVFQGYDKGAHQYKSWYNDGANAPYRVPDFPTAPDGPIQRIIFVHGINANCNTIARGTQDYGSDFIAQLKAKLDAEVDVFCYDHDLGYSRDPKNPSPGPLSRQCGTQQWSTSADHIEAPGQQQHIVTDTDTEPLSVSGPPGEQNLCDGNGPLAYDSTRLEDYLYQLYRGDVQHHRRPLTTAIIGNSMGGAITRGWTHVALHRRSPTLGMVSTVLYVQGALEGSWIAGAGQQVDFFAHLPLVGALPSLLERAGGLANLDASRPGVKDLAPQSDWYHSVADTPGPRLHYFSIYSDITFGDTDAGDGVMLPGDPSPYALPPGGGARYLPYGPRSDQHEYSVQHRVSSVLDVTGDPASHFALGQHIGQIRVTSCDQRGAKVLIPDEIARVFAHPQTACAAAGRPNHTAPAATTVRTFEPWKPDSSGYDHPAAGLVVTKDHGSCDSGSNDDPSRSDAWRCMGERVGNGQPCFSTRDSGDPGSPLLCVADPWSKSARLLSQDGSELPLAMANTEDPGQPPWALVLADGRKCIHVGYGTDIGLEPYFCGGTVGAIVPDRSQRLWTVREGRFGTTTVSGPPVAVLIAYR